MKLGFPPQQAADIMDWVAVVAVKDFSVFVIFFIVAPTPVATFGLKFTVFQ